MNLADISTSPYLASDDFTVGTIMPPAVIERIVMEEVPVAGANKKQLKAVVYFKGCKKAWAMNKNVARNIAKVLGETKNIDTAWIGASIQLVVVGDVRRPDGTRGNAFRLHQAWPKGQPTSAPAAQEPSK